MLHGPDAKLFKPSDILPSRKVTLAIKHPAFALYVLRQESIENVIEEKCARIRGHEELLTPLEGHEEIFDFDPVKEEEFSDFSRSSSPSSLPSPSPSPSPSLARKR